MAAVKGYNKNNAGVKRILREAAELSSDPSTDYTAQPLETDLFEWHCTMRGPPGSEFEGGLYHFRIILPAEYPFRPPSIVMLTPSGRFECGTKICISFTNYHEELWQPAWGVRTAIVALQGFFPLKGEAAVGLGAVEYPDSERRRLALLSKGWTCPDCGMCNEEIIPSASPPEGDVEPATEVATPANEVSIVVESRPKQPTPTPTTQSTPPLQVLPQVTLTNIASSPSRPPVLLDGAICTLLVLVAAMLFRKIF